MSEEKKEQEEKGGGNECYHKCHKEGKAKCNKCKVFHREENE